MRDAVAHEVEQLLLEHGEYEPLEFLLHQGRLSFSDYETWRNGELTHLAEALFGDPGQVGRQLAEAEAYLQRRGWQAEEIRYRSWRGQPVESASARAGDVLRFSAQLDLDGCFHRRYRRPRDQPQLDLFNDAPATNLVNGIIQALTDRDAAEAHRMLGRLYEVAPDHARLGELERLAEAVDEMHQPVSDAGAELRRLQESLVPLADNVLRTASRNLLIPLWRRLSDALGDRRFDPAASDLHASYCAAQALDWPTVRSAVEREPGWRDASVLLLRHARACEQQREFGEALPDWFTLCWRFPQHATALESSGNGDLRGAWGDFQDLDADLPEKSFPAWLLVQRPGLTRVLPEPTVDLAGCPDSYRTVYRLQRDQVQPQAAPEVDNVTLRARLKEQDAALFRQFLETVGS